MVRLDRIYTRVGDAGSTALGDGNLVSKSHPRVVAYGTVDEANATIGVAVCTIKAEGFGRNGFVELLERIQNDLFDAGADLSKPLGSDEQTGDALRVVPAQTERLELHIDELNEGLEPLDSFVLPGGTAAAANLHVARTTVRRAERRVALLLEVEPESTNPEALVYLNRLSDLLFVLARVCNDNGARDVKWVPGGE